MARRKTAPAALLPSALPPGALPSREAIRAFVAASTGRVGKREIARAFGLGPAQRAALRDILKAMAAEGVVAPAGHRRVMAPERVHPERLAERCVVRISGTDPDGDALARPLDWAGRGPPPLVLMAPEPRGQPALAPGERVLARLRPLGPGRYEGRTVKRLDTAPGRIIGVFRPARPPGGAGRIEPVDRRSKAAWLVPPGAALDAVDGEIVRAEPLAQEGYGLKPARIVERLGRLGEARSVSLLCIALHDIPQDFSAAALAAAEAAQATPLGAREDLRALPLITIDGADARDFDDAVHAEPDGAGWRLHVAIADVAHYVPPGSPLDTAARQRGNSVYFPDRVVPMLPEALSNGWCSLRPGEDRGCLFVELRIDAEGRKIAHRFGRGLMRSAARLTYEAVQQAHEAASEAGLPPGTLAALYGAFRALLAARTARGTLDLDLPERQVVLDAEGRVTGVAPRPRLDSHRLIEEFMVLANVAAAEELQRRHAPCVFRVHAAPSPEKLIALRQFLASFGLTLPPGDQLRPGDLDRVLKRVAGRPEAPLVNETMLRAQSQAAYSSENIGHFGLALGAYAHFTSPIRRYADLLVHRALIGALRLGTDGGMADDLDDLAAHITATERRAAAAERDAIDRYLAAFMADQTGAQFAARISGVTRFGIFVTLAQTGASGLVPLSALPDDFWVHDERAQTLSGRRSRQVFTLAQPVEVRLVEATPLTGGLLFAILPPPASPGSKGRRP